MTKILVIEDETPLRVEIMEWLTFEGYEVLGAQDGVEGVDYAVMNLPDLIISDISMPRLDGYGVLLAVQANTSIQSTPFIFLSARSDHDDIRKGMLLGADDYITKPFSQFELLEAIRRRLEKKAKLDAARDQQISVFKEAFEREHQAGLFREKLTAMFAHDVRSHVTVILASATLLRSYADRLTEQRRAERLIDIETSARLLLQMFDDMLVLAQMDAGNNQLKLETVDLLQFFRDLLHEFQVIPNETRQITVESDIPETMMRTDVRLLRQIATNLISNAIKYSPSHSEIQVKLEQHGTHFMLVVKDQGIGIPEADLGRLLNAFQRGSNVGRIQGTGLGLAIVKQAVDRLSGSIEIGSQVGVGTTITVSLPRDALSSSDKASRQ